MDVQGLQNRVPVASAGRVPFRQLRCILFVVGETATRQSMLREPISLFSCPVFPAAPVPIPGPVDSAGVCVA